MSTPYTSSYALRYSIPSVQQQIEVAVIHDIEDINNEDPATPDHWQAAAEAVVGITIRQVKKTGPGR